MVGSGRCRRHFPASPKLLSVAPHLFDSRPLITASILSKKLAAGLDALVMDVKVGSGALLPSLESATALAESLLAVAGEAGLRVVVLLTDMSQALGHHVGNALEVRECIGPIAVVHARSAADAEVAATALRHAVTVGEEPTAAPGHPVFRRIDTAQ